MLLKEFEDILKNIEADTMLMSYGNNRETINSILSIVNLTQSASNVISTDRGNDMFTSVIANKLRELEEIVVAQGCQRLHERGINIQQYVGNISNTPIIIPRYNGPMFYANMYNPIQSSTQPQTLMPPQQPMQSSPGPFISPQPQYVPINPSAPQSIPQPQQPPQQPTQQPTQQPIITPSPQQTKPQPQTLPSQNETIENAPSSKIETSKETSSDFVLPGAGSGSSDESAAGRDYLLKLLQDK